MGRWAQLEGKHRELLSSSCDVSLQSAQVLLTPRVMSRLQEGLAGAKRECLVSPSRCLSPSWAFSSLIQQTSAAFQSRFPATPGRCRDPSSTGRAPGQGHPGPALLRAPSAPCSPRAELARAGGLNPDSKLKIIILVNEPVFFFFFCTEAGNLGPMCEQLYINIFCTWFTWVGMRHSI